MKVLLSEDLKMILALVCADFISDGSTPEVTPFTSELNDSLKQLDSCGYAERLGDGSYRLTEDGEALGYRYLSLWLMEKSGLSRDEVLDGISSRIFDTCQVPHF